jgi:hypothetical protein
VHIRRATVMGTLVVVLTLGGSVGTISGAAATTGTKATPVGFKRVKVAKGGFSVALPGSWGVVDTTKSNAQKQLAILKKNFPSLASQLPGNAASYLQKNVVLVAIEKKVAGFAANINVIRIPGLTTAPTISDISPSILQIAPDAKFTNTRVAGVPAVRAKYNLSVTTAQGRINGVITQYAFTGNAGGLIVTLTGSVDSPHGALFTTIIKNIKLL